MVWRVIDKRCIKRATCILGGQSRSIFIPLTWGGSHTRDVFRYGITRWRTFYLGPSSQSSFDFLGFFQRLAQEKYWEPEQEGLQLQSL
jgi:hypothetical protein